MWRWRGDGWQRGGDTAGFTLLEVMVAIALLTVGAGTLARLHLAARRANITARAATMATHLAVEKMEALRARAQAVSAGGSLRTSQPGFTDYFDASGRQLDGEWSAYFVRRWVVAALASDPAQSRTLGVRVLRRPGPGGERSWPGLTPDEARLLTVVTAVRR